MEYPRVFETGVVYLAVTPSYGTDKTEDFYLVLGPSKKFMNDYLDKLPVQYHYLNLLTGEQGEFHRASYFASAAKPL